MKHSEFRGVRARRSVLLSVAFLVALVATPAAGGSGQPMLLLHLLPGDDLADACGRAPAAVNCLGATSGGVTVAGEIGTTYIALVIAANIDTAAGLSGVTFSLGYEGLTILDTGGCLDELSVGPEWPASGSALTVSTALAGCDGLTPDATDIRGRAFEVVAALLVQAEKPAALKLRGDSSGFITFRNCDREAILVEADASSAGEVGFGGVSGGNPCWGEVPTVPVTWGAIKVRAAQ